MLSFVILRIIKVLLDPRQWYLKNVLISDIKLIDLYPEYERAISLIIASFRWSWMRWYFMWTPWSVPLGNLTSSVQTTNGKSKFRIAPLETDNNVCEQREREQKRENFVKYFVFETTIIVASILRMCKQVVLISLLHKRKKNKIKIAFSRSALSYVKKSKQTRDFRITPLTYFLFLGTCFDLK